MQARESIKKHMFEKPLGAYDFFTGEISIYERLDNYPKLKEKVLEHERSHRKDKNMLMAIWRELKDYPKLYFSEEYYEFMKKEGNRYNQKWWQLLITMMNMATYTLIIQIYATFLFGVSTIYMAIRSIGEIKNDRRKTISKKEFKILQKA